MNVGSGFQQLARRARDDVQGFLDAIPYARFLGIVAEPCDDGLLLRLRFGDHLVGNTRLPALHGGAIGAFLETVALVKLVLETEGQALPKTIDITVNYLRSGRACDTSARATITKLGRRVANVSAEAWQDDPSRPIASANGHFLIAAP